MSVSFFDLEKIKTWSFANSLWTYNVGLSCCSLEFVSATSPRYDWERFGSLPCKHPSEADLLLITGPVNAKMAPDILRLYEQMRSPKFVISIGSCANTGGMFVGDDKPITGGVDKILPVDIYVPGCPPRPEALMHALLRLKERIAGTNLVGGRVNAEQ